MPPSQVKKTKRVPVPTKEAMDNLVAVSGLTKVAILQLSPKTRNSYIAAAQNSSRAFKATVAKSGAASGTAKVTKSTCYFISIFTSGLVC